MSFSSDLVISIAEIGKFHPSAPDLRKIEPFKHYFKSDGNLDLGSLDLRDGSCTRRELVLRFLLLCAVIDQGPDIIGIRELENEVTNTLYRREVRFLHTPIEFFAELGISIETILESHASIKDLQSELWAKENRSSANKYNLFMDNSRQVLAYAIFRWGVPLSLPILLLHDTYDEKIKSYPLYNYLANQDSAESMSQTLKDHNRYGLGKAIGDKASHLYAKWVVSSFRLINSGLPSWGDLSYEVPYDSNAGRVLWRTGYFLEWASLSEYVSKKVIQPKAGKGGTDYLRVTNIRGVKTRTEIAKDHIETYNLLCTKYLKSHKRRTTTVEIQRIQHIFLLENYSSRKLSVADFDNGLMYIGTNYCFNRKDPRCEECPINSLCVGFNKNTQLIERYRT